MSWKLWTYLKMTNDLSGLKGMNDLSGLICETEKNDETVVNHTTGKKYEPGQLDEKC